MENKKIKLLIVEDSQVMQRILMHIFSIDSDIEIVGMASDPYVARDLINVTNPDILTLDIEMPKMDGVTFLKNIMKLHPLPVVMVSSFTEKGNSITMEALALGAVDCMRKPTFKELENIGEYAHELITAVKNASLAKVRSPLHHSLIPYIKNGKETLHNTGLNLSNYVIAIGASTGGIEAIERLLKQLPVNVPGIMIVQHINEAFCSSFIQRLNNHSRFTVLEARRGLQIKPGHVIVAQGGIHLEIVRDHRGQYFSKLSSGEKVNGHKPSVDVLFESLALATGANGIAILLTGMGRDGGDGLRAVKNAGGETIAQNKETSVVWGMPGYAVEIKAADHILPIDKIGEHIIRKFYNIQHVRS